MLIVVLSYVLSLAVMSTYQSSQALKDTLKRLFTMLNHLEHSEKPGTLEDDLIGYMRVPDRALVVNRVPEYRDIVYTHEFDRYCQLTHAFLIALIKGL